jgi:DHA3 family tetracycline resistance protein-like MFS transporter
MNARRIYLTTATTQGFLLSLVFTISQIYRITRVGLTPLQLVLVGTTLEITAFVFEIPTGIVADVFSRKLSIIIGFLLFGVGFIVEGAFPIFAAVLLAQVIWGLGWTFISGAHEAWIADEVGVDNVGQVYMRGTQYYHFGNLLGIPIPLSVFFGKMALNLPILIGGGFFIAYGIFLSLFMPENEFTPAGSETRQTWKTMRSTLFNGIKMMRSQSVLMIFLAIAFFVGLYSEGFDRLQEAHFLSNFAFPLPELIDSVTWFGIMRLGTILLTLVATEIVKRKITTNAHIKYTRLLQIIYGVIVACLLIFARTEQFYIAIVAVWVLNTARALSYPLNTTWLNQRIDSQVRATVLSMTSQVDALGQMIGGPITGAVGTLRSLRAALITSGLMLSPAIFLFGFLGKDRFPIKINSKNPKHS